MPEEKRNERSFAPFEKSPRHEREKSRQQKKNDDKDVSYRRREVAGQFALGDCLDVTGCVHFDASFIAAVSGNVMVLNTSSKRPSSVCNSSIFHFSRVATSATAWAKSPFTAPGFG